jgi:hypothetical protein
MFLEKVFFVLFNTVLIEKLLKDIMRIIRIYAFDIFNTIDGNFSGCESYRGFEKSRKEKRVVEIKEWSENSSSH